MLTPECDLAQNGGMNSDYSTEFMRSAVCRAAKNYRLLPSHQEWATDNHSELKNYKFGACAPDG
jgi:hypothetical protein